MKTALGAVSLLISAVAFAHPVNPLLPDVPAHYIETPTDPPLRMGQEQELVSPPPQAEHQGQGSQSQNVGNPNQQQPNLPPPHIDVTVSGNVAVNAKIKGGDGSGEKGKGFYDFNITDALIAAFTVVLAFATIGLYRVTRGLLTAALQQGTDMQSLRGVAEAQERALRTQAFATVALARATRRSADIAEKALVELEAPFLYVRIIRPGISIKEIPGTADQVMHDPMGQKRWRMDFGYGLYRFSNYGRTPARIVSYFETIKIVDGETMPDPINITEIEEHLMPEGVIVLPNGGESRDYIVNALPHIFRPMFDPEKKSLFFIGFVRYSDVFGNHYRTGFCFVFDHSDDRFVLIGDENYNYRHPEEQTSQATPT
jgi:hypothetical protein